MRTPSKRLILFLLASGLFLAATFFQWVGAGPNAVKAYSANLSARIQDLETGNPALPAAAPWKHWKTQDLVSLQKENAVFLGYSGDTLVAWTKPGSFDFILADSVSRRQSGLVSTREQELYFIQPLMPGRDSGIRWVGLLPAEIPDGLIFSADPGETPILKANGQTLGYLSRVSHFQSGFSENLGLIIWLIAMIFWLLYGAVLARKTGEKRGTGFGIAALTLSGTTPVAISYLVFPGNSFFQPDFCRSFPVQLVLSASAIVLTAYWQNNGHNIRKIGTLLVPLLLTAGLWALNQYAGGLEHVLWAHWPFWQTGQWGYVVAYVFWWTAFFLFAYRLYGDWVRQEKRFFVRVAVWMIFCLGAGLTLGDLSDHQALRFLLFACSFGLCLDYFLISRVGDLTGFGFWLFVVSLGAAIFTLGPEATPAITLFNRFSYLFVLCLFLLLILLAFHNLSHRLGIAGNLPWKNADSLRTRLQRLVVSITLVTLASTGFIAYLFVKQETSASFSNTLSAELRGLALSWKNSPDNWASLEKEAKGLTWDLLYFDESGRLKNTLPGTGGPKGQMIEHMHPIAKLLANSEQQVAFGLKDGNRILYRQLSTGGFLGFRFPEQALSGRTPALFGFLSALTNICVFLFLMTGVISIFLADTLINPLVRLGEKLRLLNLESNEPLEWKRQDEIGSLVDAYNQMIGQLSERTAQLRRSEREGAWREMAKQVAHEIKNPLTPMKLSLQHLLQVRKADPRRAEEMIEEVTNNLVTQIDDLAGIATAFSNFAQMPQAVNERFSLNELCRSVAGLYAGHYAAFSTDFCQEECWMDADPALLRRALTNIIENALQAVPSSRKAAILFSLQILAGKAVIRIKDNGEGIPEIIRTKIFQPNFTTKGSGMGLGLAMTQNIILGAGGDIGFETEPGVGTTFWITLPFIQMV